MVEKVCHSIYLYAKANDKYIKDYDRNKQMSYFQYWDINNLYGSAMSQKLLVKNFKWVKYISKVNESFIKIYNKESNKGYFLENDVQYPENLNIFHNDLPFLPEGMKSEKLKSL